MLVSFQMWDDFLVYLTIDRKLSTSKSSLQALKSRFIVLTDYFKGIDFTRRAFTLFVADMQERGYSNSYMNNMIKMAKHLDRYMGKKELEDYTYFKEKPPEKIPLTPGEVEQLSLVQLPYERCGVERNHRDFVAIQFLYATACRINELCELKWVDVRNSPIPYVIFRDTKNDDDHEMPITSRIYDLLMGMPKYGENVFTSRTGKPFSKTEFNAMLKKRRDAINLNKEVHAHIFRHSRGTYLGTVLRYNDGEVAKYLNHKSLNSTKRYIHRNLQDLAVMAYSNPLEPEKSALMELKTLALDYLEKLFDKKKFEVLLDVRALTDLK